MRRRSVALSLAVVAVWVTPVVGGHDAGGPPAAATRDLQIRDWSAPTGASDGGASRERAARVADDGHDHASDAVSWRVSDVVDAGDAVMVGADWDAADDTAVQVRARDAEGWTEWVDLHVDGEHAPDEGSAEAAGAASAASEPVYVGRVDDLQFRVSGGAPALDVNLVDIDGDLSWSPTDAPAGAAVAAPAFPRVRPRASWGADESLRSGTVSYADDVRFSVVHHEGGTPRWTQKEIANGCPSADDAIRAVYEYHTRYRGWWDIAYNFIVDPCGGIWEGRAGGIDKAVMGAHAQGWNLGSVGVLALGTFSDGNSDPVTDDMVRSIEDLLAWKLDLHHTDPRGTVREVSGGGSSRYAEGTSVNVPILSAHQITNSTSCPGGALMNRLFNGRESSAHPKSVYTSNVLNEGLPKAFDDQPTRWKASARGDRPSWDVRFSEPLDWSLRITDEDDQLVRATGGSDEPRAQRTWDLRDSSGEMVDAGTYTATLTGTGPSGEITPVVTSLVISPTVIRRQGADRTATSVALSKWAFSSADTAIVASAEAYPDALVSGPLAGSLDAPVLLTSRTDLPEGVEGELRRLGVENVLVVGGEVAVGSEVVNEIRRDLPDVAIQRIGGEDRYDTAARVAAEVVGEDGIDEVLLSLGRHADESRAFPDALSAGAFGAEQTLPVFLTAGNSLPRPTREALEELTPGTVTVFGGAVAISEQVADRAADAAGATIERFAGETRYDTSRLAAQELLARRGIEVPDADGSKINLIFASGGNWPDALGAGAAAAETGTLFLLTHPGDLDQAEATRRFLERWEPQIGKGSVAGGPVAVDGRVLTQIARYVSDDEREQTQPIVWPADPNA